MVVSSGPLWMRRLGIRVAAPRDVILTGTPEGVVNVDAGDEVVTEIDRIGRLVGYIVPDAARAIA